MKDAPGISGFDPGITDTTTHNRKEAKDRMVGKRIQPTIV
jgi:hypothetical protein